MGPAALTTVLLVTLLAATLIDLRQGRIPNWVTFPALLAGLCLHSFLNGLDGFLFSLQGVGLGMGLLLVFYIAGGMGAGDVKLCGAVGGLIGPGGVFYALLATGLVGGVWGLAVLVRRLGLGGTLRRLWSACMTVFLTRQGVSLTGPSEGPVKLQYGAVIAVGTIVSEFLIGAP